MRYGVILLCVGMALLALPNMAMAQCTTWNIMQGGKMVTCVQCCHNGVCNVNCYGGA